MCRHRNTKRLVVLRVLRAAVIIEEKDCLERRDYFRCPVAGWDKPRIKRKLRRRTPPCTCLLGNFRVWGFGSNSAA